MRQGTLFLIPVPLGGHEGARSALPEAVLATARQLTHFVVENAKTARSDLKRMDHPTPLQQLSITELPRSPKPYELTELIAPLQAGHDIGLMSEAGCPAIADPGSALVALAHQLGYSVKPMVGPSSILLGLMASGMNGQHFIFHGYLPAKAEARLAALRDLEGRSHRDHRVEIFIETPYRNAAMLESITRLKPTTRICIACDLTSPTEWIRSAPVADWLKNPTPAETLDKRPAIYFIEAA